MERLLGRAAGGPGARAAGGAGADAGRDQARRGELPIRPMHGEDGRRAGERDVQRADAGNLQRRLAIHRVQGIEPAAAGGAGQHAGEGRGLHLQGGAEGICDCEGQQGGVARHVADVAGAGFWRRGEPAAGEHPGAEPAGDPAGGRGIAGGVSAAAQIFLCARERGERRLCVHAQGQRQQLFAGRDAAGTMRGIRSVGRCAGGVDAARVDGAVAGGELRAVQRAAGNRCSAWRPTTT